MDTLYKSSQCAEEVDSILKGMQTDGINSIKGIIQDIEDLIQKRLDLQEEVFNDMEKLKIQINAFRSQKEKEMTVREVLEVQKKSLEVDESKIREKIDCFKDISLLKRELRIHLAEFKDKVSKMNLLDDLIRQ